MNIKLRASLAICFVSYPCLTHLFSTSLSVTLVPKPDLNSRFEFVFIGPHVSINPNTKLDLYLKWQ